MVFEGCSVSYGELDRWSNRLAHFLIGRGAGPGRVVAVRMERSVELVVALLGVLKSGAAYVPVDPGYPSGRVEYLLGDAAPVLVVDELPEVAEFSGEAPDMEYAPGSAAYVIYTSGSTGVPKGAVLTHEGLANRLAWMQARFGLRPGDRVVQKTPFVFDVSVWEFFWPLSVGATVVVAAPGAHRDPVAMAELIVREQVSVAHFVPTMLAAFLAEPGAGDCVSLRHVVASGEALPAETVRRFGEVLPGAGLHNLYGPTEATVDVTAWTAPADFQGSVVPIGAPIANTRTYVLDEFLQPVPPGVVGDLYLAGIQLARGY
ncbi:AMP-binding protein, partial [Actinomadura barringtoniae]|uniref:AMP-binding protein n=1 Tax=Actinomadura barringtoniae TaxID=1427535 RepID=UPI0027DAE47E